MSAPGYERTSSAGLLNVRFCPEADIKAGRPRRPQMTLTSPVWKHDLVHTYRYPDEPLWTAYQPHFYGTVRPHKNALVATAQVLASII